MNKPKHPTLFLFLLSLISSLQPISSTEFLFNGFHPHNTTLYGFAHLESTTLTLTNNTNFAIGRALYPTKIPTKHPNSSQVLTFYTSFIFSMAPFKRVLPGHGIVFLFVPYTGIQSANSAQNLGFLNRTNNGLESNHVFGVEFDVFANEEFNDINANHVGVNLNSLKSIQAHDAGYFGDKDGFFKELKLNNGKNYQVWVDYQDFRLNVTMAVAGMKRPIRPLLSVFLNLSSVFEEEMYVGFTASTGQLVQSHKILGWSFSNGNFRLSEELVNHGLPSYELPKESILQSKGFIAGLVLGVLFAVLGLIVIAVLLIRRKMRLEKERKEMEDWELEYWPHRIGYQEIDKATKGFSESNVIGIGGNGKVYKGVLAGGNHVAVKRISHESNEGIREFLAEVSSLGRLKHRNLVGLRGWCKKEKGSLILVYDYMENGSLEKWVFDCDENNKMLGCEERIRVLKDVALGVLYLHEGWESKVLHRDIKASNVLLDKDMNGRLGDFGLARMHAHGEVASTTLVVGTAGYLAPEVVRTGRASTQTDVFAFGVLILEVMCGKRPVEEGKLPLVEWVWEHLGRGELVQALDGRLKDRVGEGEGFNVVERVLHLGLLCAYPDPQARPTMRQVVKVLEGGGDDEEGDEGEDMDVYLLDQMKSKDMWSKYPQSLGSHPTFEQIKESISTSMSLSWSDLIVEGR